MVPREARKIEMKVTVYTKRGTCLDVDFELPLGEWLGMVRANGGLISSNIGLFIPFDQIAEILPYQAENATITDIKPSKCDCGTVTGRHGYGCPAGGPIT